MDEFPNKFWIENDPPTAPLDLFGKFINFGGDSHPLLSSRVMYIVVRVMLVTLPGNYGWRHWYIHHRRGGGTQIVKDGPNPLRNGPHYCIVIFDPPSRCSLFLLNCPTVLSFYDTKPSPGLPSTSLKLHQHLDQPTHSSNHPTKTLFGADRGHFLTAARFIFALRLHPSFLHTFNWVMIINSTYLKRSEKGQLTD